MLQDPGIPFLHTSIIESIKDAVIVRNLSHRIIYVNKAAEKLYGFSPGEMDGMHFSELIPPEKIQEESRRFEKILWGETIENYDTERLDKKKNIISVSVSLSPFRDGEGKIIGITGLSRYIAEKTRTEGRFQALLESAPDAMVITNRYGQIVLVNAQTEKLFGFDRSELIGQEVEILIPGQYRGVHPVHRNHYMSEPKVREMGAGLDLFGLRKDGIEFPVEISLSPLHLDEGLFVSAAIRDISNQKKAALELRDYASRLELSNRELEQFAYVASHDLQEPLRNITNYAAILEETTKGSLGPDALSFLSVITSSTERMKVLISELLRFSRIGRNTVMEEVDCNVILNDVLTDLANMIKENNAIVRSEQLPVISASSIEIKQLFQNLISNAVKFRKKDIPPVIDITCTELENQWEFAFADNGIGIKEEYLDKIFLIFQRLHSDKDYPGTGIGLATCKKIVESNEGKFRVSSETGVGSTFYFTLPKIKSDQS